MEENGPDVGRPRLRAGARSGIVVTARKVHPNPERYKRYLVEAGAEVNAPSTASLRIPEVTREQIDIFLDCLQRDHAAKRLVTQVLPRCDRDNFVKFVILSTHASVEEALIEGRRERGEKVKRALRKQGREGLIEASVIERAEAAYDTRRMGLASCFPLLIVQVYVQFRAATALLPREWQALVEAACTAADRPRVIDGDVLARNLRNLAQRRPHVVPSGPQAITIIEGRSLILRPALF